MSNRTPRTNETSEKKARKKSWQRPSACYLTQNSKMVYRIPLGAYIHTG